MNVWTLSSNCFGEPRLLGVYEDAEGVAKELQHVSTYADPGDEFRIRFAEVEETSDVELRTQRCESARKEGLKKQLRSKFNARLH